MNFNLLHWLKHSQEYPKFFWKSKTKNKFIATTGKKDSLGLSQNCVFSFDLTNAHIWSPKHEQYSYQIYPSLQQENYKIIKQENTPSFKQWKALVHKSKSLNKVVLARKHTLTFDKPVCPFYLMQKIAQTSLFSFLFLYQIDQENTFLGASPETLFYKKGNLMFMEAVAGTKKRGKNSKEDKLLASSLFKDTKEMHEFSYVSNYLEQWFIEQCSTYKKSKINILKTPWVQHLQTSFEGSLQHTMSDFDIIRQLHPTPAVGGSPKEPALLFLKENELFNRSYYAAPIGRKLSNETEFAVGIRSCIVHKNTVAIYSGTGIVQDSDPEKEWEELDNKMQWIMNVIN